MTSYDIQYLIIESSVSINPSSITQLSRVSKSFNEITQTTGIISTFLTSLYGPYNVYIKTMLHHPIYFIPKIIEKISNIIGKPIPSMLLSSYSRLDQPNQETLHYLEKKCISNDTKSQDEFIDLFMKYIESVKQKSNDQETILCDMKAFIKETQFIPGYLNIPKSHYVLEKLPLEIYHSDPSFARFLLDHHGYSFEKKNSLLVSRIMWEVGYLNIWNKEKHLKKVVIQELFEKAGICLKGDAVKTMVIRNTWMQWSDEFKQMVPVKEIKKAAQSVIRDHLESPNGYALASRVAKVYNLDSMYVEEAYKEINVKTR